MSAHSLEKIASTVHEVIVAELGGEARSGEVDAAHLMSGGALDSLAMLEVVMRLEEAYDVSLDAFELNPDNFDTIDDIAKLIHSKLPADLGGSP